MQHLKEKQKQGLGMGRAIYHFVLADALHPTAIKLRQQIASNLAYQKKHGIFLPTTVKLINQLNRLFAAQRFIYENRIPDVCLDAIMNNIGDSGGTPTYILAATFHVGTGATAPAAGDTALQTEVFSNTIASRTSGAKKFYLTGFIDATEDVDHYYEAGFKSTDILLSRVAIDVNKTNTKTLTVTVEGTIAYV